MKRRKYVFKPSLNTERPFYRFMTPEQAEGRTVLIPVKGLRKGAVS